MSKLIDSFRDDHHQFDKGELAGHVGDHPFALFGEWLETAKGTELEPNAMVVSTVSESGIPSARVVYLKELSQQAFVFYTNYESRKGHDIEAHHTIHLHFFWPKSERQVSITGKASKVDEAISDAYFATRPRSSQLGAWASQQSEPLADRNELMDRIEVLEQRFPDVVPRPHFWGGYKVEPQEIEFWQGRPSRLHDRIVFRLENDSWTVFRRNP